MYVGSFVRNTYLENTAKRFNKNKNKNKMDSFHNVYRKWNISMHFIQEISGENTLCTSGKLGCNSDVSVYVFILRFPWET